MPQDPETDFLATYPTMKRAREAIEALERAGVDGSDIALIGEADAATKALHNVDRDERMLGYVFRSSMLGGSVGTAFGIVLGILVGGLVWGWSSGAMWSAAAGGAVVGGGLGVLLGGFIRLPQSDAGLAAVESSFQGTVAVGVHLPDRDPHEVVASALEGTEPQDLEQVEPDVRERNQRPGPPYDPHVEHVAPAVRSLTLGRRLPRPARGDQSPSPEPSEPSPGPGADAAAQVRSAWAGAAQTGAGVVPRLGYAVLATAVLATAAALLLVVRRARRAAARAPASGWRRLLAVAPDRQG